MQMKIFEKENLNGKEFRKKKNLAFCEFSPDFKSESGFNLTKDRRIEMRGILQGIEKMSSLLSPY